jgi:glycosyltransferase involved in cell wall biosynthesis
MDSSSSIELSVIIPCWNVAPWLPRCLEDVFAALPDKAEVIAINDGSQDETPEILERFAEKHSALKIFNQQNFGVSAARNRALNAASGEFIFFVDPDDGVELGFFTEMLTRMKEKKADYCICAFKTLHADGSAKDEKLKSIYEFTSNDAIVSGYVSRIIGYSFDSVNRFYSGEPLFARREMASVWRACFRRSIIESAHIKFDETISLYEDAIFNAEYLLAAQSMTCIDKPLYRVTERDSGAMRTIPRNALKLARNKLNLLSARKRLDALSNGKIWKMCEGSAVFSVLEILSLMVRFKLRWSDGWTILKEYLNSTKTRSALHEFPLSVKKPILTAAVLMLRLVYPRSIKKRK